MQKPLQKYQKIGNYNPDKKYDVYIPTQSKMVLNAIDLNETFTINQLIENPKISKLFSDLSPKRFKRMVLDSIFSGKKINIIQNYLEKGIPFGEFITQSLIQDWISNLRGSKYNHKEAQTRSSYGLASTQYVYANMAWHFSNWLTDKSIKVKKKITNVEGWSKEIEDEVALKDLSHFVKLYMEKTTQGTNFSILIKKYLNDPTHKGKKKKTIIGIKGMIISLFEHFELDLSLHYNPKNKYQDTKKSILRKKQISIKDLALMLTKGNPTQLEIAIVLCLYNRGLDRSTMADRFNWEAWDQLVNAFGTDDFEKWDLTKCPIKIELERIKVDFEHTGFLERDAIEAIQVYLREIRIPKFGKIQDDEALFLTSHGKPIVDYWVSKIIPKLAKKAGIQKKLEGYERTIIYEKTGHELRDLLNSVLTASGSKFFAVEESIGHMPKSNYDKSAELFAQELRTEYSKASKTLNIFSNIFSFAENGLQQEDIKEKYENMQQKYQEKDEQVTNLTEKVTQMQSEMKRITMSMETLTKIKTVISS